MLHHGLKYLLDQRLPTIPRHHWVSKLLGYDFSIEFHPGKLNIVADALFRLEEDQGLMMALSSPSFMLFDTYGHRPSTGGVAAAACGG